MQAYMVSSELIWILGKPLKPPVKSLLWRVDSERLIKNFQIFKMSSTMGPIYYTQISLINVDCTSGMDIACGTMSEVVVGLRLLPPLLLLNDRLDWSKIMNYNTGESKNLTL